MESGPESSTWERIRAFITSLRLSTKMGISGGILATSYLVVVGIVKGISLPAVILIILIGIVATAIAVPIGRRLGQFLFPPRGGRG
jgi:hypothetical protein